MKTFKLTVLGSNAAYPLHGRLTSAQIVQIGQDYILIDACESVQIQISNYKIPLQKINIILISHLHGDHIYGLPALLQSMNMHDRKKSLLIAGPEGIQEFCHFNLEITGSQLRFPIEYKIVNTSKAGILHTQLGFQIEHFPLKHRIPTSGYVIREKNDSWNIRKPAIGSYSLNIEEIKNLKNGIVPKRFEKEGLNIDDFCFPKPMERSYAYCSDTAYDEDIIPFIMKVTGLYHESTYLDELKDLAFERMHSTARQAGLIAKKAEVNHLVIGHFSPRYKNAEPLLKEAQEEFENTHLGYDGFMLNIE